MRKIVSHFGLSFLLLLAICTGASGQPDEQPDEQPDTTSQASFVRFWITAGTPLVNLSGGNIQPSPQVNLYIGGHLTPWVAFCAGPGFRRKDGYNQFPIYAGFRFAGAGRMAGPYLFLAGGYSNDPAVARDVDPVHVLGELGWKFVAGQKSTLALFVAYERLPMFTAVRRLPNRQVNRALLVPRRFELISAGLTFAF